MLIGELARLSGVAAKTIRFYEQVGIVPEPDRTSSGYRDYSSDYLELLRFLRRARAAGLSLEQIQRLLSMRNRSEPPCAHVRQMLRDRLDTVRAELAALTMLESRLEALLDHASHGPPEEPDGATVCWIIEAEV
ncbi:heavy metal-responsive transcriptional regulator [Nocardia xishanensis]|uniref:heavy metal-responsive transcriptional regulator n=1 Tax=Nocardia xishanensis TaxID=238964 RepID=UPI00342217D4